MSEKSVGSIGEFIEKHLFSIILPFWLKRGIDWANGGFYTCFNNYGDKLVSKDKYVWSQGRFLWMLSHLYRLINERLLRGTVSIGDSVDGESSGGSAVDKVRDIAKSASFGGARFLLDNAILKDGSVAWVLEEDGTPSEHRGIEADEFLIYGFAEFSVSFGERIYYEAAKRLFFNVVDRIGGRNFLSAPYGIPKGYTSHGIPMLLLETTREMVIAAEYWCDPSLSEFLSIGNNVARDSVEPFRCRDKGVLLEMVRDRGGFALNEMIGSYYNPGHTLEHAWFLIDFARNGGEKRWIDEGLELIDWIVEKSWDSEYGGFPQFLHVDGGKPKGEVSNENVGEGLISYLEKHWDKKLWWVHSEALYALLLAYVLTGKSDYWRHYKRVNDYTFNLFPNDKREIGEWIQIRKRDGVPVDEVVALPVKDPFHITRALMFMIELIRGEKN